MDFARRLLAERQELEDRIGKLDSFINGDKFSSVSTIGQELLIEQLPAMKAYKAILDKRIADLGHLPKAELTFGEKAVGITFNPSAKPEVESIKRLCANSIDELNAQRTKATEAGNGEAIAQFTLAIRKLQEGQMWGVKAATWQY